MQSHLKCVQLDFLKERHAAQDYPRNWSDLLAASHESVPCARGGLLQVERWPRHELDTQDAGRVAYCAWTGMGDFYQPLLDLGAALHQASWAFGRLVQGLASHAVGRLILRRRMP